MFEIGTREVTRYVGYYRVSTGAQARSGLGLAAQKEIVRGFLRDEDEIVEDFVEVQSGRKDNRAELAKALALAKREKASLAIARLDRFSRRLSFVAGIMEQGVKLAVAELPNATDFQLHIFAALAQEERRLISERTRVALAQAKGRGTVLGQNGRNLAVENRAKAKKFATVVQPIMAAIGFEHSSTEMARALNQRGLTTRSGRPFSAQAVQNMMHFNHDIGAG